MIQPIQVYRPLDANQVLAQFKRATELLFRRQLPFDDPALGVESAMPGLEAQDSDWESWVEAGGDLLMGQRD